MLEDGAKKVVRSKISQGHHQMYMGILAGADVLMPSGTEDKKKVRDSQDDNAHLVDCLPRYPCVEVEMRLRRESLPHCDLRIPAAST